MIGITGSLGLHVIQFPSGRWGYVGSIPIDCCRKLKANLAAVMGMRAVKDPETGDLVEYRTLTFDTKGEAFDHAKSLGHNPQ